MFSIVVLGTGNLANQWVATFSHAKDINLLAIVGRSGKSQAAFPGSIPLISTKEPIPDADLYLLAVSDGAISEVSEKLEGKKGIIAHCSGAVALEAIIPSGRRAVFYPLQTFTGGHTIPMDGVPICIEAEAAKDAEILSHLAQKISGRSQLVSSDKRKILHLAAVVVNNFANHLYFHAGRILEKNELDLDLLQPLMGQTVLKLQEMDAYEAQTGPARRGDLQTIADHKMLIRDKGFAEIYRLLSSSIQSLYHEELQGKA